MIEYWDLIVSDFQRFYMLNLYTDGVTIYEEYFYMLFTGLAYTDSAFFIQMREKYKDTTNQTAQHTHTYTKEVDNPRDFMMALKGASLKTRS